MRVPLHRLHEFITPTAAELKAFHEMTSATLSLDRGDKVCAQGDRVEHIYFLVDGWVAASIGLPNGKRQIIRIHLPGDLLGTPSLTLSCAMETLVALTPAKVDVIPVEAFGRLLAEMPRMAAAMFLTSQKERVALMDRIVSIGRTCALQRVSAFLLHVHDRLRLADPEIDDTFELPLSQQQVGDVLGMTTVHTNRTFKEMERKSLIRRRRRLVTLADVAALRELAALPERTFVREPAWLFPECRNRKRARA